MPRKTLDFSDVSDIAKAFPGVEKSFIHGAPSLKLGGKLWACPALHKSADPDSLVVRIGVAERAKLISAKPDTYYVTPHYSKYPMVLVRLAHIDRTALRGLLENSLAYAGAKTKPARAKRSKPKKRPSSR